MQTKKRAKSVKFGKKTFEENKKQSSKTPEEDQIKVKNDVVAKEDHNEADKDASIQRETDNTQEIKNQIAANISSKADKEEKSEEKISDVTERLQNNSSRSQTAFSSFTQDTEQPSKGNNLLFFVIVVLVTFIIGISAIGGFYYFTNKSALNPAPTPTGVPTVIPSPTENPVDLSEYSVEVLNGSGVSGVAAKLKTQL